MTLLAMAPIVAQRSESTLNDGWEFTRGDGVAEAVWQQVRVPHDWAIYGPFDRANDLQVVAVEQNVEKVASEKTGRTGGLPFIGKGAYRTTFEVPDTAGRDVTLVFDGAMSNARIYVNGRQISEWPYGYNSFYARIPAGLLRPGENNLEVKLENYERASRWYPGTGLYRNVHLVNTDRIHVPVWGSYITTPRVGEDYASVHQCLRIDGAAKGQRVGVRTDIVDPQGNVVATDTATYVAHGQEFAQNFLVENPQLWSPESPTLYTAVTYLSVDGLEVDRYSTRFGIRSLEYVPQKGFFLNGRPTKFKGVCNHHDLGPLGAAVNRSALRHQIELLKDMGANAIRTSHNMPTPELVELCDEMGMMLMVEPFDDWVFRPKSPNGYGSVFNEWARRDITNMVEHYRNNPSVVMWSIGNEVPSQWGPDGISELTMLQDLVHRLDPTRPVTCGMDQIGAVLDNSFAATLDIPGFNYKPQYYDEAYNRLPQGLILGSETASTVSSRGKYHFPVEFGEHRQVTHPDNQSSGYDCESCSWSNTPDLDFAMDEDREWVLGQFVWTGFDYLGEPSPYDTDAWPSHSSVFGIIDLASLPKDRYYLYRSVWNTADTTLHVLPHWNWPERKGLVTPVFVYTSLPSAELFVNGKSQGVRHKNNSSLQERYRLMWPDVIYEPGELRVVAYDADGKQAAETTVRTAGKARALKVTASRDSLRADGDPTCVMPFQKPEMKLFSGAATAIARSSSAPGQLRFKVTAPGLKSAEITLPVEPE